MSMVSLQNICVSATRVSPLSVNLGKMMDAIKKGTDAGEALEKAKGHYGQFDGAAKYIDPRHE